MSNIVKCDGNCIAKSGSIIKEGVYYEIEIYRTAKENYEFDGQYHRECLPDVEALLKTLKVDDHLSISLRK